MSDWLEIAFDCNDVDWDPVKDHANQIKHKVSFKEAAEFLNFRYFSQYQDWHDEDRYAVLGFTGRDIVLLACAETAYALRIISARKASPSEKRRYGALIYQRP